MAFTTTAEQEIVKDIKEQMCYVAIDYREELSNAANNGKLQQLYTLPDGRSLTIATERFRYVLYCFVGGTCLLSIPEAVSLTVHGPITSLGLLPYSIGVYMVLGPVWDPFH